MSEVLPDFSEISVISSLDGSPEPALLYLPERPVALLVGLHTWSADRFNQQKAMLPFCKERGWALLLPEFRGPNLTSNPRAQEAGGSPLARRDIVDATRHVLSTCADRFASKAPSIFLLGGSGGAHMALQIATREEFPWTAISAWCPITDLDQWQQENAGYAPHIHAVCGGLPAEQAAIYCEKSPIHVAENARRYRLQVAHGRHDKAVPYTHTERFADQVRGGEQFYYSIFDGAHELRLPEAFAFFDRAYADHLGAQDQAVELTG